VNRTSERAAPAKKRPPLECVQLGGEHRHFTPRAPQIARLMLRSIANDDGHFVGLEVVHG
jgi:hypothetical protein